MAQAAPILVARLGRELEIQARPVGKRLSQPTANTPAVRAV